VAFGGEDHGVEAEARVQRFELAVEQAMEVRGVAHRPGGAGGDALDAAVDAEPVEADAAEAQGAGFELGAERPGHFAQQLLQDRDVGDGFGDAADDAHGRLAQHGGDRLVEAAHRLVEAEQRVGAKRIGGEAAGEREAGDGGELADRS
jgi:hypothetical protein